MNGDDYKARYIAISNTMMCDAIMKVLIDKGICTKEELDNAVDKVVEEHPEYKENLDYYEYGLKVQELMITGKLLDKDRKYIKENGVKYDTEENINILLDALENSSKLHSMFDEKDHPGEK